MAELTLTGRFINASRALATGLVSEVVPDGELDAVAGKLAQEMVETSPLGLRLTKECLAANIDAGSLENAIYMEDRNQTLCVRAGYIAEGARPSRNANLTSRIEITAHRSGLTAGAAPTRVSGRIDRACFTLWGGVGDHFDQAEVQIQNLYRT